jgi:hypothetical protein
VWRVWTCRIAYGSTRPHHRDGRAARGAWWKYGIVALNVKILDNSAPTVAQMNEFIAFARAHPPTYLHCEAGKGRTGTAVACYRIAVDRWTADQAIAEASSFGLSLINQIAFIRQFAQAAATANPGSTPAATSPQKSERPVDRTGITHLIATGSRGKCRGTTSPRQRVRQPIATAAVMAGRSGGSDA